MPKQGSPPFEIALTLTAAPGFKAALTNKSKDTQNVLVHPLLQPIELLLYDNRGRLIESTDMRKTAKFDRSAYCEYFQLLDAGEELDSVETDFEKSDGSYSLSWEPYHFNDLPSGTYRAQARWTSGVSSCIDEDSGATKKIKGIWLGTVMSNEIELTLK